MLAHAALMPLSSLLLRQATGFSCSRVRCKVRYDAAVPNEALTVAAHAEPADHELLGMC
jgi:hypothetical protein